jgi:hypothetical protein
VVYLLQYLITYGDEEKSGEVGVFSTEEKAETVRTDLESTIEKFVCEKGIEYDRKNVSCQFFIDKYRIDEPMWKEGFVTV